MRMSQEEKQKSHARILASAARLVRERGLEGASVADVMADAGMTHGGFYKHFDSKEVMVERAIDSAFDSFVRPLSDAEGAHALAAFRALYLSEAHRAHPGSGCPVAALGPEIARGPPSLKAALGAGVRRMAGVIARGRKGSEAVRRAAALRELSMLVGAVVIARASDDALAHDVLAACGGGARDGT